MFLEYRYLPKYFKILVSDCWYYCGSKPGPCPGYCGTGGYCCAPNKPGENAGCPQDALMYMYMNTNIQHHACVVQKSGHYLSYSFTFYSLVGTSK